MKGEQRTERPTQRRQREARRRGALADSPEIPQAAALLAALLVGRTVLPEAARALTRQWEVQINAVAGADPAVAISALGRMTGAGFAVLVPLIAAVAGAGIAARLAFGGLHVTPAPITPKFTKINPAAGLKRLLSARMLWELLRVTLKTAALAAACWLTAKGILTKLLTGPGDLRSSLHRTGDGFMTLLWWVLGLTLVIALIDGVLAQRRYRKELFMTRQEVKDEARQTETNPLVKGEIRRRQSKLSRLRMMAEVANASVVVTNPTHLAVALRYDPELGAPQVVAKGAGHVALRIREIAAEHGVPRQENRPLARALFPLEIGQVIPVELYNAVAEVLAAVYRANPADAAKPRTRRARSVA